MLLYFQNKGISNSSLIWASCHIFIGAVIMCFKCCIFLAKIGTFITGSIATPHPMKCDNMPRYGGSVRVASGMGRLVDYKLSTRTSVNSVFSTQTCAEDIEETHSHSTCIQRLYHPTDRCVTATRHSSAARAFHGLKCESMSYFAAKVRADIINARLFLALHDEFF